jgi:hypothetical protein
MIRSPAPPPFSRPLALLLWFAVATAAGADVAPPNLAQNGEFDALTHWFAWGVGAGEDPEDHDGCTQSGSLSIQGDSGKSVGVYQNRPWPPAWQRASLSYFASLPEGANSSSGGRVAVGPEAGASSTLNVGLAFYPTPDCEGPAALVSSTPVAVSSLAGWARFEHLTTQVPEDTACVAIRLFYVWNGGDHETVRLDGVHLTPRSALFLEGFESADPFCRWIAVGELP